DLRGEAARLRRNIRRARAQLAGEEVDEARVATEGHEIVVDRAVFDQLVEHALRETLAEVADGPERPRDLVIHVLGDHATPLARRLVELTAGRERAEGALVRPGGPHDGVIGLAALLLPARSRPTRAATGAQAIRAARAVGSPSAPIGVPAGVGGPGLGARQGGSGHDGGGGDGQVPDDGSMPTPATGWSLPDDDADAAIPEARLPSTPVQAYRGTTPAVPAGAHPHGGDDEPGGTPEPDAVEVIEAEHDSPDHEVDHPGADRGAADDLDADRAPAGHLVLAGAAPHEVRPASDAPPGGRPTGAASAARATARWAQGGPGPEDQPGEDGQVPRAAVRGRRGPDTAPQPVPEPDSRPGAPRGAVPVLVVLVVLAVLAAVGVLLVGPDQVDAAFAGLGAGTGLLPTALWGVSW
ncbi:MAG: hypothetical protein QOE59_944, partial [Actinomycetota bacterium]|nr:hypothetical protein [Actinomycetota bacterium]